MAGTATNFNTRSVRAGTIGQIWANLAIPTAGASITLAADGTPDSGANPNAKHLGLTKEGATATIKSTFADFMADEYRNPIITVPTGCEMMINATLLQVFDFDTLALLTPGVGTPQTLVGFDRITFGTAPMIYTCMAVIFPRSDDATKFCTFQIYRAYNTAGAAFTIGNKSMSEIPVSFKALDVTGRAINDSVGQIVKPQ